MIIGADKGEKLYAMDGKTVLGLLKDYAHSRYSAFGSGGLRQMVADVKGVRTPVLVKPNVMTPAPLPADIAKAKTAGVVQERARISKCISG
jgi:hypothetical protein